MVTLPHVVGRQVIEIEVASDQGALDLLDRIGEINRVRFIPVMARVMNEFERPGVVIAIDRLDLHLGTVPDLRPDTLVERLESALRDALGEALRKGAGWPSNSGQANATRATDAVPVGAALLRSLTRYLLHGIWPYQQDAAGTPMALLAELIEHEPAALLQMIDRHRGHPELIERIALQAAFADLERLLKLIEPEKAAAILAAMKKFGDVHRVARVRDISQVRRLWRLVLQNVLNGTGAGFDSAGFEQRLLQDIPVTPASGGPALWNHAVTGEMPAGIDIARRIASAHAQSAAADLPMPQEIRSKPELAQIDLLE
ncbi:MAG TPA: contractile injection system tape measure protein, partial [Burkholderiales bacterium]|nr:contractile injection system tape measure protein [Burkholderiales bacterium]